MYTGLNRFDAHPHIFIGNGGIPAIHDKAGAAATRASGLLTPFVVYFRDIDSQLRKTLTKSLTISIQETRPSINKIFENSLINRMNIHACLGFKPSITALCNWLSANSDLH